MGTRTVQGPIYMHLLTVTCLHSKAAVVTKILISKQLTLCDVVNLSTPFLQALSTPIHKFLTLQVI